jgi:hypothetical protein
MDVSASLIEPPKWEDIEVPEEVSEESADQGVEDGQQEGALSAFAGDRGDQPNEESVICALSHGALKSHVELAKLGGGCAHADSTFPAKVVVKQAKKTVEDTLFGTGVLSVTLVIAGLVLASISDNILQNAL